MDDLLLLIICSPSGAGKTTLTKRLMARVSGLMFSVSHTTRSRRKDEVDGQDYHFVDRDEFVRMRDQGRFAEWAEVHDNLYGTSLAELERAKREGKNGILFDVDYQGARQIKARLPDARGVFILPPSLEELRRRLESRGTDSKEAIERRFQKAKVEIEHYLFFDYLIVNDDVDHASERLAGIVLAEQSTRQRLALRAENLLRTEQV